MVATDAAEKETTMITEATYLVIHTATGESLTREPLTRAAAYHGHMWQKSLTAVLLATDDRLAHIASRGYYVPAGTTVRAGLSDDVYEIWHDVEEVA
jgi:hypothetical protein